MTTFFCDDDVVLVSGPEKKSFGACWRRRQGQSSDDGDDDDKQGRHTHNQWRRTKTIRFQQTRSRFLFAVRTRTILTRASFFLSNRQPTRRDRCSYTWNMVVCTSNKEKKHDLFDPKPPKSVKRSRETHTRQ